MMIDSKPAINTIAVSVCYPGVCNTSFCYIYILGGRGPASPVFARNVHLLM